MAGRRKSTALTALAVGALATFGIVGEAAGAKVLRASMNGDREVPRGDPDGTGSARITTDRARGRVCYRITLRKVGSVSVGHIHRAPAGKAGPAVVSLFDEATRQPRGCVSNVEKSVISAIERNPRRYYVNVHNSRYPDGAVRGQLRG